MFTKREEKHLLISILVLTIIFGFDDGAKTFVLQNWVLNFIKILIFAAIAILFRELVVKFFARRHDATSEYELWSIKRMGFNKKLEKGLPLGLIISLLLTLASVGRFFFTAIGIHKLTEYKSSREGRKFATLNYFEEAQIASTSILSSLFLAVVGLIIGNIFDFNMTYFVNINFFIALFNMLPISNLDGAKIFFGSIILYIFVAIFLIVSFVLIKFTIIFGLLIAFLAAILGVGLYFYKSNY